MACDCRVLLLSAVPHAVVDRDTRGVVKLVAEAGTGRVRGVHIVADGAGEVIAAAVYAIRRPVGRVPPARVPPLGAEGGAPGWDVASCRGALSPFCRLEHSGAEDKRGGGRRRQAQALMTLRVARPR